MPNIQYHYEYRDAVNYKNFGSMIFSNPEGMTDLNAVEEIIRKHLIDEEFFYPDKLSVPSIHFPTWNPKTDHQWYRFEKLEFTDEPPTDPRSFQQFLMEMKEFAIQPLI